MAGPRKARAGFSLVELLAAVVVVAALVVIVPKLLGAGQRGEEAALQADLNTLRDAISRFHDDTSLYPMRLADLAATIAPGQGLNDEGQDRALTSVAWHGPYLKSVPTDPISGMEFHYLTAPDAEHQTGAVRSSAAGTASDGTLYSHW
jgi:general secretion pathway protein G